LHDPEKQSSSVEHCSVVFVRHVQSLLRHMPLAHSGPLKHVARSCSLGLHCRGFSSLLQYESAEHSSSIAPVHVAPPGLLQVRVESPSQIEEAHSLLLEHVSPIAFVLTWHCRLTQLDDEQSSFALHASPMSALGLRGVHVMNDEPDSPLQRPLKQAGHAEPGMPHSRPVLRRQTLSRQ
jgi:hypothetical protein